MKNLPPSEMIESCFVAGPGFMNDASSRNWNSIELTQRMLNDGVDTWETLLPLKWTIIDFP